MNKILSTLLVTGAALLAAAGTAHAGSGTGTGGTTAPPTTPAGNVATTSMALRVSLGAGSTLDVQGLPASQGLPYPFQKLPLDGEVVGEIFGAKGGTHFIRTGSLGHTVYSVELWAWRVSERSVLVTGKFGVSAKTYVEKEIPVTEVSVGDPQPMGGVFCSPQDPKVCIGFFAPVSVSPA